MRKLTMKPSRVFYYFEEISRIPRGSGNTKGVSDFCAAFAKEQGLDYIQDAVNNVVIWKEGSKGREQEEPVILQGHLDMVCEKNLDCAHDFKKDPLTLIVDGDCIRADQTTLGGDDGIAIAYALAILESSEYSHPPLEVIFTIDEETGMQGATALDASVLKGHRVLNLDSEEEGILLTSCAGGVKCHCQLPVNHVEVEHMARMEVEITGLSGGHSGTEIDKGRCNANKLMGRLLFHLSQKFSFGIASSRLSGGLQDNAIPREARTVLFMEPELAEQAAEEIRSFCQMMKEELGRKEPELQIGTSLPVLQEKQSILSPSSAQKVLFLLHQSPNGVQEMSSEISGLVETSLNLGIMHLDEHMFTMDFAIRSSVGSAKVALRDKLIYLTEFLGGECLADGDYPAWEFKRDSEFREICIQAYQQVYGKEPEVKALHAGLECGILSDKIKGFDAVSMGPDVYDIHTPQERMSIASVQRTWDYLLKILEMV
ncbi:MAG: aminoacyl-histidine dipeptidase [Lachnospiraceae bacterium]|nr:aminoacyl-histidine dipeptidase [Lachnospiraceae bacterium]